MLHRNIAAIDISEQSIKVLKLNAAREIVSYGSSQLETGIVENGLIKNGEAFSAKLDEVLRSTKPEVLRPAQRSLQCILSLPESQLFLHYLELPDSIKNDAIEEYVKKEAAGVIPFALGEMYSTYHIARIDDIQHVTFVATPKDVVHNYVKVLTEANLRPAAIGGGFFSLGRALMPNDIGEDNYIIIDIGAHATNIGVFDVDAVANFTASVPVGGTHLTAKVAERLTLSLDEAERIKKERGMMPSDTGDGLADALTEGLSDAVQEIKRVKTYYEEKTERKITKAILAGGSALLPGIGAHIASQIGIEVRIGEPFLKLKEYSAFPSDTPPIFFAGVIGLALRGLDDTLPGVDLLTEYRRDRDDGGKESIPLRDIRSLGEALYVVRGMLGKTKEKTSKVIHRLHLDVRVNVKLLLSTLFALSMLGVLIVVIIMYT